MNIKFDLECTPEEARTFLGLPDLRPLNDQMVEEMRSRMMSLAPEELMKNWMSFGGQATEQFRKLMTAAVSSAGAPKTST
jgi:hypothetical protein